jgi:hypothetical protein
VVLIGASAVAADPVVASSARTAVHSNNLFMVITTYLSLR